MPWYYRRQGRLHVVIYFLIWVYFQILYRGIQECYNLFFLNIIGPGSMEYKTDLTQLFHPCREGAESIILRLDYSIRYIYLLNGRLK